MRRSGTVESNQPPLPPVAEVNPGKNCVSVLDRAGIKTNVLPFYDDVLELFHTINLNLDKLDQNGFACLRKELSMLSRNCTDPNVKIVIRDERASINGKINDYLAKMDRDSKGSFLTMSTKPTPVFKEFR